MDYLSGLICWGYDPSRMADSIGAVIGINGEERSLGSLAGLEAQPLHKAKTKAGCGGLGVLKRRPYNDAHNGEAKASEPASEGTLQESFSCGTGYPTSGRSLAVKPDVSACFFNHLQWHLRW